MARAATQPLVTAAAVEAERVRVRRPSWPALLAASAFLLAAVLTGLFVGPVGIGLGSIVEAAASHVPFLGVKSHLSQADSAILWQLRLPRVVLACLVGAMLSSAGAAYQGVFRNPLVDPYLLGVAAGAGVGATLVIVYAHGTTLDSDLIVDLGLDSLQVLEVIAELEDRFDISIPLNDVPATRTVAQVVGEVTKIVAERTPS